MAKKEDGLYIFDVNKINDFIFKDFGNRTNDVEITENYGFDAEGKQIPTSRTVKEVKTSDFSGQTTRYDLVKTFMEILENIEINSSGEPVNMTLGQMIALNTMNAYGLITRN